MITEEEKAALEDAKAEKDYIFGDWVLHDEMLKKGFIRSGHRRYEITKLGLETLAASFEEKVVDEDVKIINAKEEAARRKGQPVATGVLAYFPDALLAVAEVSRVGNDQHNPGQPLHWAKDKSTDEPDALARHLIDYLRGGDQKFDTDGVRHAAKIAWRALALLQREIDAEKK